MIPTASGTAYFGPSFINGVGGGINLVGINASDRKTIGAWGSSNIKILEMNQPGAIPSPLTPDNESFTINYENLSVGSISVPTVIPSGINVNLTTTISGGTSSPNLNYQWYKVPQNFSLTHPFLGAITNTLSTSFTSNTIIALLVTDNGISTYPTAYNWAFINVSTMSLTLAANAIAYGAPDLMKLRPYSANDEANISIDGSVVECGMAGALAGKLYK